MPAKLTAKAVEALAREARATGERVDVRDGGCPGLELRAGPKGAVWRLYYSDRRTGEKWRLVLGHWPEMTLEDARAEATSQRARVRDPRVQANPAKERRDRRMGTGRTFEQVARQRLDAGGNDVLSNNTYDLYGWCFTKHAFPAFGGMAISDVRVEDVHALVSKVERESGPVAADKVRIAVSSVLGWASREMILKGPNVALGIRRRSSGEGRDRVLSDAELRTLLAGVAASAIGREMRDILHLLVLTAQRSTEVREAEARELRWRGVEVHGVAHAGPTWVIPGHRLVRGELVGGRTKNRREQVLPLSTQAAAVFASAVELAVPDLDDRERFWSQYLDERKEKPPPADLFERSNYFWRSQAKERVMLKVERKVERLFAVGDARAVARAMKRVCERIGLEDATPHDLRRTAATWLGGRGFRPDVVEAILNHTPQGVTKRVYDRSRLLPMMAEAMQAWGDHVQSLMPEQRK